MKKLQQLVLFLALGLTMRSLGAITHDISTGDLDIVDGGEYVVTGSTTEHVINIYGITTTIILSNASINVSENALYVGSPQEVYLFLAGENFLSSANRTAIRVREDSTLYIDGPGYLSATGGKDYCSGIGSQDHECCGTIIINGGTIAATSGGSIAGIGGREGSVTINGGNITATGCGNGAGIGGCSNYKTGDITISGGSITAKGDGNAAGIGGGVGYDGQAGNIIISGGIVKATSFSGAGIGCGNAGGYNTYPAGTVTITGGTVEASSVNGAGIGAGGGSGNSGRGPSIYISGGSVLATSKKGDPVGQGFYYCDCPVALNAPEGSQIYCATLPDAAAEENALSAVNAGDLSFTTARDGAPYSYAYAGPGHEKSDDLYFYLPDGAYVVTGSNGKAFGGTVNGGDATFAALPEPALGLLAFLAAALLRRK